MARPRTATRRRRTVATVISNPGRGRKARRKAPRVTRRNPRRLKSKSRRKATRQSMKRRSTKRHRNPSRKAYRRTASKARRKLYRKSKRHSAHLHNPWKLSSKSRRGSKRIRRNPRRRSYRSNPGVGKMFKKVPVIGGTLAAAFGSMPAGLIAGFAMEIPLRLSPIVASQTWIPTILKENEFAYFTILSALSGAVTAGALKAAGISKIPFLGSVANLPGLMTAAGAGAGYVKMRSRQMANEIGIATPEQQVGGEEAVSGLGAIVASSTGGMGLISADMGMGPGFSVAPGGFAGASLGAVLVGS